MEKSYVQFGVINSRGEFLSHDEEFYYYGDLNASALLDDFEAANLYLESAKEHFKDTKIGERINFYDRPEDTYDPDMTVVEVEVSLKVKK